MKCPIRLMLENKLQTYNSLEVLTTQKTKSECKYVKHKRKAVLACNDFNIANAWNEEYKQELSLADPLQYCLKCY